jgi:predicted secreted protein
MADTEASIGYGTLLEVSTDNEVTWHPVGEVTNITPPSDAVDAVDATHMQSPGRTREFIAGLSDPGECSIEQNFVPGSDAEVRLRAIKAAGTRAKWRITWPNAVSWRFTGFITGIEATAPVDDKMAATVTIKVTGATAPTPAAAPVNSVKPAISGVGQVGQTLTAFAGQWSGAPTFTYQWKNEGVAIGGATNRTYVLAAGDVGDTISIAVTATNAAGSATADSAGLADIIA